MDFLNRMTRVIDYVEDHISEELDLSSLAGIICCSAYQFGRIFSYVVGCSLAEYVRCRRLSLAALELSRKERKVIDIAMKYGYSSPESFARAFKELHGVTPREASEPGVRLRMYPRITFQISIKGAVDMEYRIVDKGIIEGVGVTKNFGKFRVDQQQESWKEQMGDVWQFYGRFLNQGENLILRDQYKLYRAPFWQICVSFTDQEDNLILSIGAEDGGGNYPELTKFQVPAATWAVFTARGPLNHKEHPVDALTTKIFSEWLPSSGYEQSMEYQIEVYGPGDTGNEDYSCEVWIPVKKSVSGLPTP